MTPRANHRYNSPMPSRRGAYRDRHGRRGGMRWTLWRGAISRQTKTLRRTVKSCGPGAAMLALSWRSYSLMTVAIKPAHRGEHEAAVKTIAQGMSECSPLTCMLVCAKCAIFGTRDRGCSAHPAFPAPSVSRVRQRICITRAKSRREIADAHSTSSLRKQGPIRRGRSGLKRWSTT